MSNSIKNFGYGYLIGDAALATASILQGRQQAIDNQIDFSKTQGYSSAVAGGLYGVSSVIAAVYGNPSTEKKLELLYSDMRQDLKKMGLHITADVTPELLAKEDGLIDGIQKFLYRNPTQVIHAIFALGGVKNMIGGLPSNGQEFNGSNFVSGALITIGGLVGLLVNEKAPDPAHPPQGVGQKIVAYAQEKPLRASANIFTANNLFLLTAARSDHQHYAHSTNGAQHSWILKLVTAAAYVTSNFFLSHSKRDNAGAQDSEQEAFMRQLRTTAAKVVSAQPAALQQTALTQVAGYLSTRPEVHQTAAQLLAEMQADILRLAPSVSLAR